MSSETRAVLLAIVLAFLVGVAPALAQQETAADDPPAAEQDADEADDADDVDPLIRDDVFTPSEEIEADSEISFPADI